MGHVLKLGATLYKSIEYVSVLHTYGTFLGQLIFFSVIGCIPRGGQAVSLPGSSLQHTVLGQMCNMLTQA